MSSLPRPLTLLLGLVACGVVPAFGQPAAQLEERVAGILAASCATAGCHAAPNAQMNLDLRRSHYLTAVGKRALTRPDLYLIHPGQPDRSYLVMKIEGAEGIVGQRMPFDGERLAPEDVAAIRAWIAGLDEDAGSRAEAPPPDRFAFMGWRAVNLPTNRSVAPRTLVATIGHRFNPRFDTGYDTFFGLDGSSVIFLSLGYAPVEGLLLNLGRSNVEGNVEAAASYIILSEDARGPPLSVGLRGAANWLTASPGTGASVAGTAQVILTRSIGGDRGGLAVVPGVLLHPADAERQTLLTLGTAARWRVSGRVSLIAEWVPIVSGHSPSFTFGNPNRFDSWGGGVEIATAGHVFQIVASNTVGIATDQYLRGGDLDARRLQFRLGFNIYRLFNV